MSNGLVALASSTSASISPSPKSNFSASGSSVLLLVQPAKYPGLITDAKQNVAAVISQREERCIETSSAVVCNTDASPSRLGTQIIPAPGAERVPACATRSAKLSKDGEPVGPPYPRRAKPSRRLGSRAPLATTRGPRA